jgi:hypothetical protein
MHRERIGIFAPLELHPCRKYKQKSRSRQLSSLAVTGSCERCSRISM